MCDTVKGMEEKLGREMSEPNGQKETASHSPPWITTDFLCTSLCSHKATVCPRQKCHRETIAHIYNSFIYTTIANTRHTRNIF